MKSKLEEYKVIEKECAEVYKVYDNLIEKKIKIEKELIEYIIKNGLYGKLNTLKKYEGCDIDSVTLVYKDGTTEDMSCDEIFDIIDGHFHYSSYNWGILEYCEQLKEYRYYLHGTSEKRDIIGYLDLKLYDYKKEYNSYNVEKIIKKIK